MIALDPPRPLTLFPEPRPRLIDLFAGAGGMTEGFREAGFESVLAVEIDRAAAETYRLNFASNTEVATDASNPAHVYACPVEEITSFPAAEVVIGGPPCQGFSPLGKDRDADERAEMNELWNEYVRVVRQVKPLAFVIENVPEFLKSAQYQKFLEVFTKDPSHPDFDPDLSLYEIDQQVLRAEEFGVPQRRRRGIVIGSRVGTPQWPTKTHGPNAMPPSPTVTVREAIGDLPASPTNSDLHWGRNPTVKSIERYHAVPMGGNRFDLAANRPDLLPDCWRNKKSGTTDVFGRLWWDRPSLTIRTEFFKPEKGRYLHPQEHRPITHREAARLQTFPDSFLFHGSKIQVARQIGNAVPPLLARAIAVAVMELLPATDLRPVPSGGQRGPNGRTRVAIRS